jgi:hypothetical protein
MKMRVFCPEHHKGFLSPRQSPIRCENKGHVLGDLNFDGELKTPLELRWQYCCNCEHFCPIDVRLDSLARCPVCTRRSSIFHLCDRCGTISFESNTPLQTKNFTVTAMGALQPACPGCLQETSTDLREHTCDELGITLITALNTCPGCHERLDIGPSFPCSVAHFLRKTKASNKTNVTFDYETELFIPVGDGEFVLIGNASDSVQLIVIPRSTSLQTKRDFYEFYQDFYHCTNPEAGELHIVEPAAVTSTTQGWQLQAPGILEVLEGPSRKKAVIEPTVQRQPSTPHVGPKASPPRTSAQSLESPCPHCGALVETKYPFCWGCGKSIRADDTASVAYLDKSRMIEPTAAIIADDEATLQHEAPAKAPLFSWALPKDSDPSSSKGSILKLIAVAAIALGLLSLGLFALTRTVSRLESVTAAQAPQDERAAPVALPARDGTADVAAVQTLPAATPARTADDELKALRQRRITATAKDRTAILLAFGRAERRYPNDYRFPYEEAKLAMQVSRSSSREEAFRALADAAERAISAGKSREMLASLEAEKANDFRKLANGSHEWNQLVRALTRNDSSLLMATARF